MRTKRLQQADGAALVAEHDEVLAKDAQPSRQVAQFARENDRLPETPQVFATRRARPDAGHFLVFCWHSTMVVGAVGGGQEWRSFNHDEPRCVAVAASGSGISSLQ